MLSNDYDEVVGQLKMDDVEELENKQLKKLFISCPMHGRTKEAIEKSMDKMHKIAEIYFDQKLEVLNHEIDVFDDWQYEMLVLSKNLKNLYEADYFIGIGPNYKWFNCKAEWEIAHYYAIPKAQVEIDCIAPDVCEEYDDSFN